MEIVAKRLKWLREMKRLSQKEVAAEIEMSLNGYQKIEYNQRDPKLEVLVKLARLYEVSTDFILGLSNTNEQLEDIEEQIYNYKFRYESSSKLHTTYTHRLVSLKLQIEQLIKRVETNKNEKDMEVLKVAQKELNELKEREKEATYEMYNSLNYYHSYLTKYIYNLINVPEVNVTEDEIISEFAPLRARLSEANYTDYNVLVDSKDKGHIGILNENLTREAADKLMERFNYVFRDILY